MKNLGFKQRVKEYTRSSINSDTIIDLAFFSMDIQTKVLKRPRIIDHFMVEIDIPTKNKNTKKDIYNDDRTILC